MNSCNFRVFLQGLGITVRLSLPGSVSEKERLLLGLLVQGVSVTEVSRYGDRSARTTSHRKKQLFEELGIQSDIILWRNIFFQYNPEIISAAGSDNHRHINGNHCHHTVVSEVINLALKNHGFKPWVQPVFRAQAGILTSYEVLARWEHPQARAIPPNQFTPLAESSDFIVIVARRLMGQTADTLVSVRHLLPDNFHIGIDASTDCFLTAGFEKECLDLVSKLGNDKIKLVLELAERNPILIAPEARTIFNSLHQHNIIFVLDNFGIGYATCCYLQALPIDSIKIDKSFVRVVSVDEIFGHIVDNVIELACRLGLNIVAEGIETQE